MQPLFDKLQTLLGGNASFKIGLILAALLALLMLLMLAGTMRQLFFEGRQRRFDRERLRLQIRTASFLCREAEQAQSSWNGYRKFRVAKKVCEAKDCCSFYLVPHDGRRLPLFKPGQFLTFQVNIPNESKPVVRCYSLSDSPIHPDSPECPKHYRVTIKREIRKDGTPGLASSYFCDVVKEGDILDVKAPGGHFKLELAQERPVVLIGGGVGVTPMLSMLNAIVASGSKREAWFFYGVRDRGEHVQKEHLEKIAEENENVHLHICYSRPGKEDRLGQDYQHGERVSADLFKRVLPSNNFEYYLCGPGPFMTSITEGLKAWGVPESNVFYEAFGPGSVPKKTAPATATSAEAVKPIQVNFSKSGKICEWTPAGDVTLLELAEANGVPIPSQCRTGSCQTCLVAVKSGEVSYPKDLNAPPEGGSCLTCMGRPKSAVVLDA
jgi:ferredoxin-NADP reductase